MKELLIPYLILYVCPRSDQISEDLSCFKIFFKNRPQGLVVIDVLIMTLIDTFRLPESYDQVMVFVTVFLGKFNVPFSEVGKYVLR